MNYTPDQMELFGRFRIDMRTLADEALKFGVPARMAAVNMLAISHEIAKEGGPIVEFDHALWVQGEGTRLLRQFEAEYGDKLDWPSLIDGRLVPKKSALN